MYPVVTCTWSTTVRWSHAWTRHAWWPMQRVISLVQPSGEWLDGFSERVHPSHGRIIVRWPSAWSPHTWSLCNGSPLRQHTSGSTQEMSRWHRHSVMVYPVHVPHTWTPMSRGTMTQVLLSWHNPSRRERKSTPKPEVKYQNFPHYAVWCHL